MERLVKDISPVVFIGLIIPFALIAFIGLVIGTAAWPIIGR
jgi:hypothetical protein